MSGGSNRFHAWQVPAPLLQQRSLHQKVLGTDCGERSSLRRNSRNGFQGPGQCLRVLSQGGVHLSLSIPRRAGRPSLPPPSFHLLIWHSSLEGPLGWSRGRRTPIGWQPCCFRLHQVSRWLRSSPPGSKRGNSPGAFNDCGVLVHCWAELIRRRWLRLCDRWKSPDG